MTAPLFSPAFRASLDQLFTWRRDVRHFRTDPVPEAVLSRLLETACLAPSVGLSEPWRFVRVDAPARRAEIRENFARCNAEALTGHSGDDAQRYATLKLAGLDDAPHHIAVFCDTNPAQGARAGTWHHAGNHGVVCRYGDPHLLAGGHGGGCRAGVGLYSEPGGRKPHALYYAGLAVSGLFVRRLSGRTGRHARTGTTGVGTAQPGPQAVD